MLFRNSTNRHRFMYIYIYVCMLSDTCMSICIYVAGASGPGHPIVYIVGYEAKVESHEVAYAPLVQQRSRILAGALRLLIHSVQTRGGGREEACNLLIIEEA